MSKRKPRRRAVEHQHAYVHTPQEDGSSGEHAQQPDREEISAVYNIQGALTDALADLTSDVLLKTLSQMPQAGRQMMLRTIGLKSAVSVTRGMATQLLARLRSPDAPMDSEPLMALTSPVVNLFASDLPPDAWKHIGGNDALAAVAVFTLYPEFAQRIEGLTENLDEAILRLGMVMALHLDTPGAAAALGFLAVDNPDAAAAYDKLGQLCPDLLPLPQLTVVNASPTRRARTLGHLGADEHFGRRLEAYLLRMVESAEATADAVVTEGAAQPESSGLTSMPQRPEAGLADQADPAVPNVQSEGLADGLLAEVQVALDAWDEHAQLAGSVAAALAEGRQPQSDALDEVVEFVDSLTALAGLLDEGPQVSLQSLQAAAARLGVERLSQDRRWLADLMTVHGPEVSGDAIALVHATARRLFDEPGAATSEIAGLRHLHHLIELAAARRDGQPFDFAEVAAAETAAREHLPEMVPAIFAAAVGALSWSPDSPVVEPNQVPDERVAEVAAGRPMSESPRQNDHASTPLHQDAGPEVPTGSPPSTDALPMTDLKVASVDHDRAQGDASQPDAISVQTEPAAQIPTQENAYERNVVAPAREDTTDQEPDRGTATNLVVDAANDADPDGSPNATGEGGPDLSDLDALLAGGTGASLSAIGVDRARRAPHVVATPILEKPAEDVEQNQDATALTWSDVVVQEAHAAAVAGHRFGLAADIAAAGGAPAASVSARRLAAYGVALRTATGQLASAFATESPQITRDNLADDRCGQLLAWAAAARVAVLAPGAGPAGILLELAPCVLDSSGLSEVGNALMEASRTGLVVLPEAANAVGTLASAENELYDARKTVTDLLEGAGSHPIKYVPANGVYQAWLNPDGPLGELLTSILAGDIHNVSTVRDATLALRGRGDKAIDSTFAGKRRNKTNTIGAGARGTLRTRWDDVLDASDRWTFAVERVAERQLATRADKWQTGPLSQLRTRLNVVRDQALAEVSEAAGDAGVFSQATDEAVTYLLESAFQVCDGQAPTGDEPQPQFVVHQEVLTLDISLPAGSMAPSQPDLCAALPALITTAGRPPVTADAAYATLAAAGHHDLTALLIAGVRASDPREAMALELARAQDVAASALVAAENVADLRRLIDIRRMVGALSEVTWSTLSAKVEALDSAARRDFGRIGNEVAATREELDRHQSILVQSTLDRIQERSAENAAVAEVADTLSELARQGQIASAEEYLQQTVAGGTLPFFEQDVDHFSVFYPSVCEVGTSRPDLLAVLRSALDGGTGREISELAAAGLNTEGLSVSRREAGKRALGAWAALCSSSGAGRPVDATTALRLVLAEAGLEFAELKFESGQNAVPGRQWVTLLKVQDTGDALTPTLGSAMSPDGSTMRVLLVRSAPTPATVIEWMRSQPADRTVLVLWLPGALSVVERRALANASRGRAQPPVVVMDAAALSYLVCQSEPRRSTLAAITLPFTAASPYRDTPGDVAPEMFYGRTDELAAVLDLQGPSVVSGGRQLGKSALLRRAERLFRDSDAGREAVLTSIFTVGGDGDADRVWVALWPRLAGLGIVQGVLPSSDVAEQVHDSIIQWIEADAGRALIILLDEADAFLDADAAGNRFANVEWCRRIMLDSGRRAKFVFAGLHRTARFDSLPNQPLSHFGRPISVGPLSAQPAYDLATRPLGALGFRFADRLATPARILALANNMPALLQLFGAALVEYLTSRPVPEDSAVQLVTDEDVDAVFASPELLEAFREKYVLTLNLDHRYLVIAYTVAQAAYDEGADASLSLGQLSERSRESWPGGFGNCGADDFRGLASECVDLGLLAFDQDRYRMRTPTVLRLLGTEDEVLTTLLAAPERLSVPLASDAGSYRRHVRGGRCPLTERQLGALFAAQGQTVVVAGTAALGIDRVLSGIEEALDQGAARVTKLVTAHTATPDGLRSALARAIPGALVVMDARTLASEALTTLLMAATGLNASHSQVGVAVVASSANAAAWIGWPNRVDLDRWDLAGLRMLCDEENLPFRDDDSREQLLTVTGGWPFLITKAADIVHDAGPVASGDMVLASLRTWLHGPGGARLLDAVGASVGQHALRTALLRLAELDSTVGEDLDTLAELLGLADDHLAAAAAAVGYAGLELLVTALASSGVLTIDGDGLWSVEPCLAGVAREAAAEALVTPAPAVTT